MITQQPLTYSTYDLCPHLNPWVVQSHYMEYSLPHFDAVNELMDGMVIDGFDLNQALYVVTRNTCNHELLHHLCSAWNHDFYWEGLCPPMHHDQNSVMDEICRQFGSIDEFKQEFIDVGAKAHGSTWTWLVSQNDKLIIKSCPGSMCPSLHTPSTPLFVVDGWEHAYISQYGNNKIEYYTAIMNLINWERVNDRFCRSI